MFNFTTARFFVVAEIDTMGLEVQLRKRYPDDPAKVKRLKLERVNRARRVIHARGLKPHKHFTHARDDKASEAEAQRQADAYVKKLRAALKDGGVRMRCRTGTGMFL